MVRDPVTGEIISYAEMSIRLQQRRKQRQLEEARASNPEGVLVHARNTENTGAPMKRGVGQTHWQRYEKGGDVNHPGQPIGTDTVPAWLTPGEFVVNAEAVRMYGPQIEAMNNHGRALQRAQGGTIPQHYDIGGKVKKIYEEGYTAPGQAYAIAKSMGYSTGGLVSFLKKHEGYRDKAYQDSAGVWTIGYGRTTNADGSSIKPNQTTTRDAEDAWIVDRAASERKAIDDYAAKHGYDWSDNQKDALASFRYNGGQGMLDMLTDGGKRDTATIESKIGLYNKVTDPKTGKKVAIDGLTNRRNAELELWGGQGNQVSGNQEAQVVPPDEPVPAPQEEVVDVSPSAEAADQVSLGDPGGFPIGQLVNQLGQQSFSPAPSIGLQGVNPEFIPSVTAREPDNPRNRNQFYNQGGPVYMANGGWLDFLWGSEEDKAKTAQALRRRPGIRTADPLAGSIIDTRGPQQPLQPSQFGADQVPPSGAYPTDPSIPRFDQQAGVIQGQIGAAQAPAAGAVPAIEDTPPVPGSDEALLQSSSQSVERKEEEQLRRRHQELNAVEEGAEYDPRGNNQVPTPDWQMSPEGQSVTQPVNEQPIDRTPSVLQAVTGSDAIPNSRQLRGLAGDPVISEGPPQLDAPPEPGGYADLSQGEFLQEAAADQEIIDEVAPDVDDPRAGHDSGAATGARGETHEQRAERHLTQNKPAVEQAIADKGEPLTPELEEMNSDEATKRAQELATKQPGIQNFAQNTLKQAFGDLFDRKELGRMAIMFLGAMATGASPGQALAFAGTQYLNRVDAAASNYQKIAASGKYTKESVAAYKQSRDPNDLVALGAQPERTGNFSTRYTKDGKEIQVEEVKVGDNTIFVDKNGRQVSGFDTTTTSPADRRKEVNDYGRDLGPIVKGLHEQFDQFETDKGKGTKTQIVPEVAARKAAEFFVEEGIDPTAAAGIIEASYHDMINDNTEGRQKRDLVPYIRQNIIRQKVGNHTQAFVVKPAKDGKPAEYVDPARLQQLNAAASSWLRKQGVTGGTTEDLSNQFYTAALEDWNNLSPDERALHNKSAAKGTNGFYTFAEGWLLDRQ